MKKNWIEYILICILLILGLDQFIQQLRDTCTHKVKANSVKQEYEKQDELKRSALRAVWALSKIPKAGILNKINYYWFRGSILIHSYLLQFFLEKNQQLTDFLKSINDSPELSKIYEYVQKDSLSNNLDFTMDES